MNVRKKIHLELYVNNQYIWLKITVHNYITAYLHCRIRTRDSNSNLLGLQNGYIALCRSFHTTRIQIPILTGNYRNGIRIRVRTRVRLPQWKWAIRNSRPMLDFFQYTDCYSQIFQHEVGLNHVHCWKSVNIRGIP